MDDKKKPMVVREAAVRYEATPPEWISAAEFKTHCLRLIEQVRQDRKQVVVTRYGQPVARLVPYDLEPAPVLGHLAGSVTFYGDLVSPIGEEWDAGA
ncbi:MAG TPA: type II toxin-antitoxin system Phd/YefM family antitoxin [Longimicrobiaceae bacterium]|jgi:prevent-host-death family protein|nr:type II toxin-antitoxin system Phd/YefM family antitoxin [Longimicrobiaceae bacterium]